MDRGILVNISATLALAVTGNVLAGNTLMLGAMRLQLSGKQRQKD